MSKELRVLLVEDNPADAELVLRELRRGGFNPIWNRVDTEPDYLNRLNEDLEIVLSDFALPDFSGLRALELLKQRDSQIPFIIISGTIGEEIAVGAMRQGATDYLMKDRLARLCPAINHALTQSSLRKARQQAEEALKESEGRFRQVVEHIEDVFWMVDTVSGQVLFISAAYQKLWGKTCESLYADPNSWIESVHPDDRDRVLKTLKSREGSHSYDQEYRIIHPDGSIRWIHDHGTEILDSQGRPYRLAGVAQDITERKKAEQIVSERAVFSEMIAKVGVAVTRSIEMSTGLELSAAVIVQHLNAAYARVWLLNEDTNVLELRACAPRDRKLESEHRRYLIGESRVGMIAQQRRSFHTNKVMEHPDLAKSHWMQSAGLQSFAGFPLVAGGILLGVLTVYSRNPISESQFQGLEEVAQTLALFVQQRRSEQARLEQQHRLAGIIDSAMDGIITIDERRHIILFNPAAERMFEVASAEAMGLPIEHFIPLPVTPTQSRQLEDGLLGIRKNGSKFPIEATVSEIAVDGRKLVTITCRDVTEKARAEETRKTLEAQLRQAQKMEAIGTLAGGIAHDFNNILSAILGNVQLAQMEAKISVSDCLAAIQKAGLRAKDLVQQILSFSRQRVTERSIIPLGPIIDEVVSLMNATLPASVHLVKYTANDAPSVLADSTQIHQVLVNLCTNSWHAMEDTPGRLEVRLEKVTLDAQQAMELSGLRAGHYACISVSDTGKGMDAETMEQIFDPFFTTKEPGKGTGLGLSVVHGIIQSHDGAVKVTSKVGIGTTFRLFFPAVQPEIAAPEKTKGELQLGNGEHILLLDDERSLVFMTSRLLEHLRYKVTCFTSADEASDAFRSNPNGFDVVITDMNMPTSSGLKIAEDFIRVRSEVPVILSSGYINETLIAKASKAGIKALLYKPATIEELGEAIYRVLYLESAT